MAGGREPSRAGSDRAARRTGGMFLCFRAPGCGKGRGRRWLLILCFAYAGLEDDGALGARGGSWLEVAALVLFVIAARSGVVLVRTGWKYEAASAEQLVKEDPRPPVLYLRSF